MPYKDLDKKRERHKKYMKEVWYPKNKVKHIRYQTEIKKRIIEYILTLKGSSKCADCGFSGKEFPCVLDFDHIKDLKKFNISEFKHYTNSFKKVVEEIKKCDIVCANCHRIRTVKRKNMSM